MRNLLSVLTFICLASLVNAQQGEIKTLFDSGDQPTTFGGFGGMFVGATPLAGTWGVTIGGKGAAIVNRKFSFGGFGGGFSGSSSFRGDNFRGNENAELTVDMGYGGVFFEYILNLSDPVHLSFPVHFAGGGATVEERFTNVEVESTGLFIIEPGIGVEFNVARFFIPAINVTYRFAIGNSLENLDTADLSGLHISAFFKFGGF